MSEQSVALSGPACGWEDRAPGQINEIRAMVGAAPHAAHNRRRRMPSVRRISLKLMISPICSALTFR